MRHSADQPTLASLEEARPRTRPHVRTQRLVGLLIVVALCAAGVAVPLALQGGPERATHRRVTRHVRTNKPAPNRHALNAVASALAATTAAGSFRVTYTLWETPGTPTTACAAVKVLADRPPGVPPATTCFYGTHDVKTTGFATVNVNPFAMVAVSNVSSFGDVTVRVDDTNVWETGGADYGLVPSSPDQGPGSPLSGFASLVEGTLGRREGAGAMMGLSSPTGYLSITREAIIGATNIGTGTVDDVPVTIYRVDVDPAILANVPGLSSEETTTIHDALDVLHAEGFTGNTTDVSVDAAGYVRHTTSVNHFSDGGSVTSDTTFSAFGCAGVVQMPGRPITVAATPTECADGTSESTTIPASTTVP